MPTHQHTITFSAASSACIDTSKNYVLRICVFFWRGAETTAWGKRRNHSKTRSTAAVSAALLCLKRVGFTRYPICTPGL
jgi:hypothetical protein